MENIVHAYVEVNGLKLHVAGIGSASSPVVVFLHGFPEIWYSWCHQMIAVAEAGFRAIAPDYRGYGLSDPPPAPEKTTFLDLVADLLALLDALSLSKVFLVAKDFGAIVLSLFTLLHQDRVLGFVTLGVPFMLPRPPTYHQQLPEGFYMSRWKEPGRAEADFGRLDAKTVVRNEYIMFSKSEIPMADENQEIMDLVGNHQPRCLAGLLRKILQPMGPCMRNPVSGLHCRFLTGNGLVNQICCVELVIAFHCRSTGTQLDLPDPKVEVPALLIMGEKDYVIKFPGIEDYIRNGTAKSVVPNLEITCIPEDSHFVQEQSTDEVNSLILNFLETHK